MNLLNPLIWLLYLVSWPILPFTLPFSAIRLATSCDVATPATLLSVVHLDAVACEATLVLPAYGNATESALVPCAAFSRCLSRHYRQAHPACDSVTVVTNHWRQGRACLRVAIDEYERVVFPDHTDLLQLFWAGLVSLPVMVAILKSAH